MYVLYRSHGEETPKPSWASDEWAGDGWAMSGSDLELITPSLIGKG